MGEDLFSCSSESGVVSAIQNDLYAHDTMGYTDVKDMQT
jgi:hypothetical protein